MKKVVVLLCAGVIAMLTSCSQYTCATYATTGLKEKQPVAANTEPGDNVMYQLR